MKNYSFLGTTILRVLKSQLLLFAMLLCFAPEAKGETIFSLQVTYGSDYNLNNGGGTLALNSTYANCTGGTVTAHNDKTGDGSQKILGSDNSERHFRYASSDIYLEINLSNALQEGDVISFNSNQDRPICITATSTRNTSHQFYPSSSASSPKSYTITNSDGLAGVTTLYVWRVSDNTTAIKTLTITRGGATKTVYLDIANTWINDNAKIYVHTWGSSDYDAEMTPADCQGNILKATNIPSGNTDLIFVRREPSATGIWNGTEWNRIQTTFDGSKNLYTTSGGTTGSWTGNYIPSYTVHFDRNGKGSSDPDDQCVSSGSKASAPTNPTHAGYTVDGWYENSACTGSAWNFSSNTITGEKTLYAHWTCVAPNEFDLSGTWQYCKGQTITLTANPGNKASDATYQWYKDGTEDGNKILGATSATYTKSNAQMADRGTYYCQVTNGTCSRMSRAFNVRMWTLRGFNEDWSTDHIFEATGATTASVSVHLNAETTTYFKIYDGFCWYGKEKTREICYTITKDNLQVTGNAGGDCNGMDNIAIVTEMEGDYIFTINYATANSPQVTVTYPSANQAAGKVIYFDNSVTQWADLHYRIGRKDHNQATAMTKVPGTDNLYKVTTAAYNNFTAWSIGNKEGWTDANSIYRTKTGDAHAITKAIAFRKYAVTQDAITVTPGNEHSTGAEDINNNCEFYSLETINGLKIQRITMGAAANGSISADFTDVNGNAASIIPSTAEANKIVAHSCILTITATPDPGYHLASLTVGGSPFTSGQQYTVLQPTTIAATFEADAPSGACFEMVLKSGKKIQDLSNATRELTSTYATISGGQAWLGNKNSDASKGKMNDDANIQFGGADGYVKIQMDNALAIGSVISYSNTKGNTEQLCFTAISTRSTAYSGTSGSYTVKAGDALIGKNTFYVWRAGGSSAYLNTLTVTGCGGASSSHTITFNKNDGSNTTATQEDVADNTATALSVLSSIGWSRTGYTFAGWAETSNGAVAYTDGANITITDNVTLYAKWTANNYTITLDNQTATTAGTASVTATYASNTNLTSAITCPAKTDFTFGGYYTEALGGGMQVIDADGNFLASVKGYTDAEKNWTRSSNVTLYAKWTAAASACFSMEIKDDAASLSVSKNDSHTLTSSEANITADCSVVLHNYDTEKDGRIQIDNHQIKLGSAKAALEVTLDHALAVGDVISFTNDGTNSEQIAFTTNNIRATTLATVNGSYMVTSSDALVGATTFYVWRASGNTTYIKTLSIECAGDCTPTGLAYATAELSKAVGNAAFTNPLTNPHSLTVTYSSSDQQVATVASNGEVTIVGAGSTTITATALAQNGYCTDQVSYTLNVCQAPSITSQPTSTTVNTGVQAYLSVTAAGNDLSYQWQSSNAADGTFTNVGGATKSTYSRKPSAMGTIYYRCVVSNDCGSDTSNVVSITATKGAPEVTWNVPSTVYKGQLVPFSVSTTTDAILAAGNLTGSYLNNITLVGKTFQGYLRIPADAANFTLTLSTAEGTAFSALSEDFNVEVSNDCPEALPEIVYSAHLTSKSEAVATGGTATVNKNFDDGSTKVIDGKTYIKMGSSSQITLAPTGGFLAGDRLTIDVCANSNGTSGVKITDASSTQLADLTTAITTSKSSLLEYTFTAATASVSLTRHDSKCNFYGASLTRATSATALHWDDDEAEDGIVTKDPDDANFTITASANSIGTISYASSNTSVATVNGSTGEVVVKKTIGETTISATVTAVGTCYAAKTITYLLRVADDCVNPVITQQPEGAECYKNDTPALSVTAEGDNLTYQWYSSAAENAEGAAIGGATLRTYTPATASLGTQYYYCVVSSGYCSTTSEMVAIVVNRRPCTGDIITPTLIVTTPLSQCNETMTVKAVNPDGNTDLPVGTFQWYEDGEEIVGATSASYTITHAGTYSVEYTVGDCTVEADKKAYVDTKSSSLSQLAPFQYYHLGQTYTQQMKMRHLFVVKSYNDTKLTLAAEDQNGTDVTSNILPAISYESDEEAIDTVMIDLNRLDPALFSVNDVITITATPYNACGNLEHAKKQTIDIRVIDETPTLAFIIPGADGDGTKDKKQLKLNGDFLTGYNKADLCLQTDKTAFNAETELPLYTMLKENYIVTPVNGYAPFSKYNYEPFDLLFLTDFVKTDGGSNKDAAKQKVNELGLLVDYRPIFTTKCHMSGIANWEKVGFIANPVAPAQTQKWMNITCYAHPMFDAFKEADVPHEASSGEVVFTMADQGGFDSNKAVQGFTMQGAANFVTVAVTHRDAQANIVDNVVNPSNVGAEDELLVASCERQTNPEARLLMLAINADAHSFISEQGMDVIHLSLEYLLDIRPVTITDCSITFDNGELAHDYETHVTGTRVVELTVTNNIASPEVPDHAVLHTVENGDGTYTHTFTYTSGNDKWSNPANWNARFVPTSVNNVRIVKPVIIDTPAEALTVKICHDNNAKNEDGVTPVTEEGHITITPTGSLSTKSRIYRVEQGKYVTFSPTHADDVLIETNAGVNGALIHGDIEGKTSATIEFYSISNGATGMGNDTPNWQWMATPFNDVDRAIQQYYYAWVTEFVNADHGWTNIVHNEDPMHPFRGYAITQDAGDAAGLTYVMNGVLAPTANQTISLAYSGSNGINLIGNSWTAPINIAQWQASDFVNATATIVLFNTGRDVDGTGTENAAGTESHTAGTYVSIPVNTAGTLDPALQVIPSMQAFQVKATGAGASLKMNYEQLVRPASGTVNHQALRAPQRGAQEPQLSNGIGEKLRINLRGQRYSDFIYLFQHDDCTEGFDNGWDGEKIYSDNYDIPVLYVENAAGDWQISTQPSLAGTHFGFYRGEDARYTLTFEYVGYETLYLYDVNTDTYTRISNDATYEFTSNTFNLERRFLLTDYNPYAPVLPEVPTGLVDMEELKDGLMFTNTTGEQMHICIYDPAGRLCFSTSTSAPLYRATLPSQAGIYLIDMATPSRHEVRKVVR